MPSHPPGQLNKRSHRRGFDHGPVVVMVTPHFRDRRTQDDEQMMRFRAGIHQGAYRRLSEDRIDPIRGAAVKHGV